MVPALRNGEFALVRPCFPEAIAVGDVVLVRHPYRRDLELLKRVAAIVDGAMVLRGDNPAESTDSRTFGAVPMSQLIGRVERRWCAPPIRRPSTRPGS